MKIEEYEMRLNTNLQKIRVRERELEREVERDGKKVKLPSLMSEVSRLVNEEAVRLGVVVLEVEQPVLEQQQSRFE